MKFPLVFTAFVFVFLTADAWASECIFRFEVIDTATISGWWSIKENSQIDVDWGDGTQSSFSGLRQAYAKTYASKVDATVRIYGESDDVLTGFAMNEPSANIRFNLSSLPAGVTYLSCTGANTVYGDVADLPGTLTNFQVEGRNNNIVGDFLDFPRDLEVFYCSGANTIKGDVKDLPKGLRSLRLRGNNVASGNINSLPDGLAYFYCQGRNTLEGEIEELPKNLTLFHCDGHNTIGGDLAKLPDKMTYFRCVGNNEIAEYSFPKKWPDGMRCVHLQPETPHGLNTVEVDRLLNDLAMVDWTLEKKVWISGNNAAPSVDSQAAIMELQNKNVDVNVNKKKRKILTEEEVYNQRWTREDFKKTIMESQTWFNNDIGKCKYAPEPWTPMQVNGQEIECLGRSYRYSDSILPVQVMSNGEELYAGQPVFSLEHRGIFYEFRDADVRIEKVHDGLVEVHAVSRSGPYILELNKEYEFDGMVRIKLTLRSNSPEVGVDGFYLGFPLKPEHSILYNLTGARYGLEIQQGGGPASPPLCRSGFVPDEGEKLDTFREIVWFGDRDVGFTWFAESMKGWRIRNEKNIQSIGPVQDGQRVFSVKLADKPFVLEEPMELVFGLMATPMKPQPQNFKKLYEKYHFTWKWWEGYNTIEIDTYPDEARKWISELRDNGKEFMPYRSLEYMGNCRYYKSQFGVVKNPAMYLREIMLWGDAWGIPYQGIPAMAARGRSQKSIYNESEYSPSEAADIKRQVLHERSRGTLRGRSLDEVMRMRHTPASKTYYGKLYKPQEEAGRRGEVILYRMFPDSPFKDYHIWKLNEAVQKTGLRAIYFDQQLRASLDAQNANGYIDYKGEWAPETPIFAMREAMKRIYFLFIENNNEPPLIKWHCSLQMVIPALSFVDIVWEGEKYNLGKHDFYSEVLSEGQMQAMHLGKQFGFVPFFLTMLHRMPRTPRLASVRDETGLLLIHDAIGAVGPVHHRNYIKHVFDKWSSYPHDTMRTVYYWDDDGRIVVTPSDSIKYIMHYNDDSILLILFNWSSNTQLAKVTFGQELPASNKNIEYIKDVLNGSVIEYETRTFKVDLLPRDFRMIEINLSNERKP